MAGISKETLGQYVTRIMKAKGLKQDEVRQLSGNRITDGYVRDIMTGRANNPSVEKLKALALGLRVSEDDLFRVARGLPLDREGKETFESSNYDVIVNLMCASLKSRALTELLYEAARLSPSLHEDVVKFLRHLNERTEAATRSTKAG